MVRVVIKRVGEGRRGVVALVRGAVGRRRVAGSGGDALLLARQAAVRREPQRERVEPAGGLGVFGGGEQDGELEVARGRVVAVAPLCVCACMERGRGGY